MIIDDFLNIADLPTKEEKAIEIDYLITKGNEKIIKMIFDDMITFNVAVVRLPELRLNIPLVIIPTNQELEDLLEKLANKTLTGNAALTACANFGNRLDDA